MCIRDRFCEEDEAGRTDLAILENVGNLVCPAEFDTGASANAMILSCLLYTSRCV